LFARNRMSVTTRVLCAIDAAYPCRPAIETAIEMARLLDVPVAFLAIKPIYGEGTSRARFWDRRILAAVEGHLSGVLADASRLARQAGLEDFACVVASGIDIAAAIADYARENGFDHIVFGSSRPAAPTTTAQGSLVAAVVATAGCTVTIVR